MEKYFYLNSNNEQAGPISPEDFGRYGVSETTMIWKQGMPNWVRAGQIPELSSFFHTPPIPVGGNTHNSRTNGFSGQNQYKPIKPDNNMAWAVLSTVLCCMPIGIYSVIQASKVNGLYNSGFYDEAQHMADEAKKWAGIGAIAGLVFSALYFIILLVFADM